jgi:hypothetical protein
MENNLGVALLTGGRDQHYAFGLSESLLSRGTTMGLIRGDYLDGPDPWQA